MPWDGVGGVIAVERHPLERRGAAQAQRRDGDGDITVDADHLAQIDATTTSRIEAWDAKSLVVAFNAIGWIPVNIFFCAADMLTARRTTSTTTTSNDRPATLHDGDAVRVDSGPYAGQSSSTRVRPQRLDRPDARVPELRRRGPSGYNETSSLSTGPHDYTSTQTIASHARRQARQDPGRH